MLAFGWSSFRLRDNVGSLRLVWNRALAFALGE